MRIAMVALALTALAGCKAEKTVVEANKSGHFQIVTTPAGAILLDTQSGDTWTAEPISPREIAWVKSKRLDAMPAGAPAPVAEPAGGNNAEP